MTTSPIKVRPETREKFDKFADRTRLSMVEVADIAIDALGLLTRDQLAALIEKRPMPDKPSRGREHQVV